MDFSSWFSLKMPNPVGVHRGNERDCSWFLKTTRAKNTKERYMSKVGNIYISTLVWVMSLALVGTPIVFHGNRKYKAFWRENLLLLFIPNLKYDWSPDSLMFPKALHSIRREAPLPPLTAPTLVRQCRRCAPCSLTYRWRSWRCRSREIMSNLLRSPVPTNWVLHLQRKPRW